MENTEIQTVQTAIFCVAAFLTVYCFAAASRMQAKQNGRMEWSELKAALPTIVGAAMKKLSEKQREEHDKKREKYCFSPFSFLILYAWASLCLFYTHIDFF